jgi:hypothetical protein
MLSSQDAHRRDQLARPWFHRSSLQHPTSCSWSDGAKSANEKTITETFQRKLVENLQPCIFVGPKSASDVRVLGALISSVTWIVRHAHIRHLERQHTGMATKSASENEDRRDTLKNTGRKFAALHHDWARRAVLKSARSYKTVSDDEGPSEERSTIRI